MENLKGKVAIVTGGSSGIGRAICLALSDEECKIAVLSRNRAPTRGGEPTDTLLKEGIWVYCDVSKSPLDSKEGSKSGSLTDAIQSVVDKYGRLDILVNNAGLASFKDFLEQSEEDYDNIIDTNLKGTIFASQLAIKQMLFKQSEPGGQIINIASIYGILHSVAPIFGASKAGIINFAQNIVAHFGGKIKCNCICPGYISTGPLPPENMGKLARAQKEPASEVPLKREGQPAEVAEAVVWILKSSYISGATVVVDGGRNARITTGMDFGDGI